MTIYAVNDPLPRRTSADFRSKARDPGVERLKNPVHMATHHHKRHQVVSVAGEEVEGVDESLSQSRVAEVPDGRAIIKPAFRRANDRFQPSAAQSDKVVPAGRGRRLSSVRQRSISSKP